MGNDDITILDDYAVLDQWAEDKDFFYLIGLTMRPGVMLWAVRLEHEFYPPRTEKNRLLRFGIVNWENMKFIVVGFPIGDRHKAEGLAKSCNLRFANGVPLLKSARGDAFFPMNPDAANVWNLENVGENWTTNYEPLMELQQREIDRILEDDADLRLGKVNLSL